MANRIRLGLMRGVARQGTATMNIPISGFYNYFLLKVRGGSAANSNGALSTAAARDSIKELRILINAQVIWRVSGEMLGMINSYFDLPESNTSIPLFFIRSWLRTNFGENSTRLASFLAGSGGRITLEVDFVDAYYPRQVEVWANHDQRGIEGVTPNNAYRAFRYVGRNHQSVGIEQVPANEFAQGAEILSAIYIKSPLITNESGAVLDEIKIISNQATIYHTDADTRQFERALLGRVFVPGMETIEFADKNLIGESFSPTPPNLRLELDWKTIPNAYDIILDQTNVAAFAGNRRTA